MKVGGQLHAPTGLSPGSLALGLIIYSGFIQVQLAKGSVKR